MVPVEIYAGCIEREAGEGAFQEQKNLSVLPLPQLQSVAETAQKHRGKDGYLRKMPIDV